MGAWFRCLKLKERFDLQGLRCNNVAVVTETLITSLGLVKPEKRLSKASVAL